MKETKERYELMSKEYKNEFITIDNSIVRAREKTNLLESKIEILAIHHLDKNSKIKEKKDNYGNTYQVNYVVLSAKEIQQLMGRDDGDTYNDIRHAAFALKEKYLIVENKESRQFVLRSMYGDVAYDNGSLYVEFNPDVQDLFLDMKEKFTKLSLPIMFSFKKNGGFQLYKVLKSYAFSPNLPKIDMKLSQSELPSYRISYELTDLRMVLGYVDINQDKLKEEASKKNPNFEKMAKEEKKPQYKRWSDFNVRVIEPGVKEINTISDIYISEVVKNTSGRGGRVTSIDFYIQHNKAYYEAQQEDVLQEDKNSDVVKELSNEQKADFYDEILDIIEEKIKIKDAMTIAEASLYDIERIKTAYEVLKLYSKNHKEVNVVGFVLKAIKENWEPDISTKSSSSKEDSVSKTKFSNFNERDYDYEEFIKDILKNN